MPLFGLGRVKKALEVIAEGANDDIIEVWIGGLQNIVEGTPARSGLARNSWFLTQNAPSSGVRLQPRRSGSASLNQIARNMPKSVLGKKLFFTNTAPHINVLEYGGYPNPVKNGSFFEGRFQKLSSGGYSKQAPGGWVRKDLILMRQKIRSLR